MIDGPIKDAKRPELDAELDLYKRGLGEGNDVADQSTLSTKADCVAEIERLQAAHGIPIELTPEFIADNQELAKHLMDGGYKEGDIVFGQETDFAPFLHQGDEPQKNDNKANTTTGATAVAVYDTDGKIVRVYSQELHGEDYQDLAKQFISHSGREGFTIKVYVPPAPPTPPREETEFVNVVTPSGDVDRVFSLKLHGETYREMAENYVAKYASRNLRVAEPVRLDE